MIFDIFWMERILKAFKPDAMVGNCGNLFKVEPWEPLTRERWKKFTDFCMKTFSVENDYSTGPDYER